MKRIFILLFCVAVFYTKSSGQTILPPDEEEEDIPTKPTTISPWIHFGINTILSQQIGRNVGIGLDGEALSKLDVNGDIRTSKLIDRNNTGYYLDPASTSNLNNVIANYHSVSSGNGKGIRFWNSNSYKIHMGNSSEYKYGPVQDYSIKMNMNNDSDRGWTWGVSGATPIAALNTEGKLQVKGDITSEGKVIASGGNSEDWNKAFNERGSQIAGKGLSWTGTQLNVIPDAQQYWTYNEKGLVPTKALGFLCTQDLRWYECDGSLGYIIKAAQGSFTIGAPFKNGDYILTHVDGDRTIIYGERNATFEVFGDRVQVDGNIISDRAISRSLTVSGEATIYNHLLIGPQPSNFPSNPTGKLYVNGAAYFTDINVQASGSWPDFVFGNDYKLISLKETEEFIKKNQHLPDVPSAQEIEEEGMNVAEMNKILLQKIEELTLHLIDQNKKMEALQNEVNELKSANK